MSCVAQRGFAKAAKSRRRSKPERDILISNPTTFTDYQMAAQIILVAWLLFVQTAIAEHITLRMLSGLMKNSLTRLRVSKIE
jgi:hypothetical protein